MLLSDLFERDVTRTIPPVVYFHEQSPAELKREVDEYIITGGYPEKDDRATPDGIHEQFVRLLAGIRRELDKTQVELPACWISGYYGSGKSSFAKLLGLALDGLDLEPGKSLSAALLAQDRSPNAQELRDAWARVLEKVKPMAVVFDVGSKARDEEHVHAVVVRQVQQRLGYSKTSNLVAEYELKLELEGLSDAFMDKVQEVHGKPWSALKDSQLVEDEFSRVMHALRPDLFHDPMSWVDSRAGSAYGSKRSADEAVEAVHHMLAKRYPGRTLFIVVDEVSQYVHENTERMLALQSFVSALGQRMKGKAWLLATGQQKLEEGTGAGASIAKLKDRFPPALRVHLGVANIRDVVHKRLLRKKGVVEGDLRALFQQHRAELSLYAYKGEDVSETAFVEIYPLLPKHVDLLLDITTGLRSRSTRMQGDSYAIRGLLQLLGDLFREKGLANREVGWLITMDLVYDVLHSALGPDVQLTISRALEHCAKTSSKLGARVVKAVAMLEMIQEREKTTADLVARCLYERLGQGSIASDVQKALDDLVGHGFLASSEKTGYKIESAAGQEWQRDRDFYQPTAENVSELVRRRLLEILGNDKPSLDGMEVPWLALYSDGLSARDIRLKDERKHTVVTVDFQYTNDKAEEWVSRSNGEGYKNRFVWLIGSMGDVKSYATKALQSSRMIARYDSNEASLAEDTRRLLVEERNREASLTRELRDAIADAFMKGHFFFRGRQKLPADLGQTFNKALSAYGAEVARALYPQPMTFSVKESDILFLIESKDLSAPPPVLGEEKLGILKLDSGRYEAACSGRLPTDVLAVVKEHGAVEGATLLQQFGSPPHGIAPDLVRATVVGLLRGGKVRVVIPGVGELTSVKDEGTRELLKESGLKRAQISLNTKDPLTARDRNAICALFKDALHVDVARDNDAIADAVASRFAAIRDRLNTINDRFRKLPKVAVYPEALTKLERALEDCRRNRQVEPTLNAVKTSVPTLRDGLTLLRRMETDLSEPVIALLAKAADVQHQAAALRADQPTEDIAMAIATLEAQLAGPHPWEGTAGLDEAIEKLRLSYQERRRALLDAHAKQQEQRIEEIKRRDGFDRLDADQRHQVTTHLRAGAAANTDEKAIAPALEVLPTLLRDRLEHATEKALMQLSALLEAQGGPPTVEVSLEFRGREIKTEAELDRFIEELRRRIAHELSANNYVRLK